MAGDLAGMVRGVDQFVGVGWRGMVRGLGRRGWVRVGGRGRGAKAGNVLKIIMPQNQQISPELAENPH